MKKFDKILDSFSRFHVMVIGDVMMDSYVWGKVNRISPEAPIPVVATERKENRLGGAANVALNLQSLGAKPFLCSVIGDDEMGRMFLNVCKEHEIDTEGILISRIRKTTVKTRIIAQNQHVLRIDEETDDMIDHYIEEEFISSISSRLSRGDIHAIIFEDYDKGTLTPAVISNVIDLAKKNNIPVGADPKKRNFRNFKNIYLFKPNFTELCEGLYLDIRKNEPQNIQEAARILHERQNIEILIITLSDKGLVISAPGLFEIIPARFRDIVDVSGAGDTVISVAMLSLLSGANIRQTGIISNTAGGIVCEKSGVIPIDKNALVQELNE